MEREGHQKGNDVGFGLSQEATEGSNRQRISTSEAGLTISFQWKQCSTKTSCRWSSSL